MVQKKNKRKPRSLEQQKKRNLKAAKKDKKQELLFLIIHQVNQKQKLLYEFVIDNI